MYKNNAHKQMAMTLDVYAQRGEWDRTEKSTRECLELAGYEPTNAQVAALTPKRQVVYVTIHNHKHGIDTYLNKTLAGAHAQVVSLIVDLELDEMKSHVRAVFADDFDKALFNYNEVEQDNFQVYAQGIGE